MTRPYFAFLLGSLMAVALSVAAQQETATSKKSAEALQEQIPTANPGRPTVATPATLTPVGYLQFETGYLGAWQSPEFSSQSSFNEVVKFSLTRRIELLAGAEPFARSRVGNQTGNATGGVAVGVQGVVYRGEGARPTIAMSYLRAVHSGDVPDLDLGSPQNALLFLASADLKGFHYDANFFFNDVVNNAIHRAQFGQTLSVSHALVKKVGISGEIWHFTQPFLRSDVIGNLWALNYNARKNLVLDVGFSHGLTSTSTQWAVFTGFTYLLPHKLIPGSLLKTASRRQPIEAAHRRRDRIDW